MPPAAAKQQPLIIRWMACSLGKLHKPHSLNQTRALTFQQAQAQHLKKNTKLDQHTSLKSHIHARYLMLTQQQLLHVSKGRVGDYCQPTGRVGTAQADAQPAGHNAATSGASSSSISPWAAEVQQMAHQQLPDTAAGVSGERQQGIEGNARPPAVFMLDSMCSHVCRWLRCLGVDAEFVDPQVARDKVPDISEASGREGRVFLTRDSKLAGRRGVGALFLLSSDNTEEQLQDIVQHFGIRYDVRQAMSRCSRCNAAAFEQKKQRRTLGSYNKAKKAHNKSEDPDESSSGMDLLPSEDGPDDEEGPNEEGEAGQQEEDGNVPDLTGNSTTNSAAPLGQDTACASQRVGQGVGDEQVRLPQLNPLPDKTGSWAKP
ncbi:hypothetical protein WJX74_007001 [Apatococcus lobatus]|uniref:Mut7-C RNAse domain-containing protein n=1 Tax=Apatococcus lobatus TaxID=904363 RepID=A0AAW1QAK1_9CHLO